MARLGKRLARESTSPPPFSQLEPEEQRRAREFAVVLARELEARDGLGLADAERQVLRAWSALVAEHENSAAAQGELWRLFGSVVGPALTEMRERARIRLIRLGVTLLTELWCSAPGESVRDYLTDVLVEDFSIRITGDGNHPLVLDVLRNVFWPLVNDMWPEPTADDVDTLVMSSSAVRARP